MSPKRRDDLQGIDASFSTESFGYFVPVLHDAAWIDDWLLEQQIEPVILSKSIEDRDASAVEFEKASYRRRYVVEQVIGWLKECRRVASRYDKLARNYPSMVNLSFVVATRCCGADIWTLRMFDGTSLVMRFR